MKNLNLIEMPITAIEDNFEEAVGNYESLIEGQESLFDTVYKLYDDRQLDNQTIEILTKVVNRACELEREKQDDNRKSLEDYHITIKSEFGKFLTKKGNDL